MCAWQSTQNSVRQLLDGLVGGLNDWATTVIGVAHDLSQPASISHDPIQQTLVAVF
jgi:hypothetical protein